MRIALMGGRGVPANYGGFETLMEELGVRLVARGHDVTAYCRTPHIQYAGDEYRGVRLVKFGTVRNKHLDTIVHTTLCAVHALTQRYDLVLMVNAGNSPVSWIPRLAGQVVVLHVDGRDWQRAKWGRWAKRYIQWCERLSPRLPTHFISDSAVVGQYYSRELGRAPDAIIGYGGEPSPVAPGAALRSLRLQPRRYVLFVGRLVPENCVHHVIDACGSLDGGFKCVVVGDAPYQEDYIRKLKSSSGDSTVFTGYLFGHAYRELCSNAYLVIESSEVGGMHPAIVEAMAMGNCVIANGIAENRETMGNAGLFYNGSGGSTALGAVLSRLLANPDEVEIWRQRAQEHASRYFDWENIVDQYERFFARCLQSDPAAEPAHRDLQPVPIECDPSPAMEPVLAGSRSASLNGAARIES